MKILLGLGLVFCVVGICSGEIIKGEPSLDRFVEVKFGQHTHTLATYKDRLYDALEGRVAEIGDTFENVLETKINFGYRKGNQAYILGVGRFGEIRTIWEWPDGSSGSCSFDSYFGDFTYRHYFGIRNPHPKGLVAYGEGGVGLYLSRWRFNDDRVTWTVKETEGAEEESFRNPRLEGSDIGWHIGSGFTYYFSPDFSIDVEGLYRWIYIENGWVFPDDFSQDVYRERRNVYLFQIDENRRDNGLELDLSGLSLNLGFNMHF
jgi:hypothetical protein